MIVRARPLSVVISIFLDQVALLNGRPLLPRPSLALAYLYARVWQNSLQQLSCPNRAASGHDTHFCPFTVQKIVSCCLSSAAPLALQPYTMHGRHSGRSQPEQSDIENELATEG
jgi:hypothetical protein